MKFINFFSIFRVIFALLDPDPDTDPGTSLNPDPIRIRIHNTGSGFILLTLSEAAGSSRAMSQPEEFSLESVRQLMLAHGGRVTNHSLVKSYRQWLTDPQLKDQARAQFKVSILLGSSEQSCSAFLTSSRASYLSHTVSQFFGNKQRCGAINFSFGSGYDSVSTEPQIRMLLRL
jgi:hypothetical protein